MTSNNIGFELNGESQSLQAPLSLIELIEQQQMTGQRFLVVINDEVVTKSHWTQTVIKTGDKVDIMSPITGG